MSQYPDVKLIDYNYTVKPITESTDIRGLDITIIMSSLNNDHSLELLRKLNFPFKEERNN